MRASGKRTSALRVVEEKSRRIFFVERRPGEGLFPRCAARFLPLGGWATTLRGSRFFRFEGFVSLGRCLLIDFEKGEEMGCRLVGRFERSGPVKQGDVGMRREMIRSD